MGVSGICQHEGASSIHIEPCFYEKSTFSNDLNCAAIACFLLKKPPRNRGGKQAAIAARRRRWRPSNSPCCEQSGQNRCCGYGKKLASGNFNNHIFDHVKSISRRFISLVPLRSLRNDHAGGESGELHLHSVCFQAPLKIGSRARLSGFGKNPVGGGISLV